MAPASKLPLWHWRRYALVHFAVGLGLALLLLRLTDPRWMSADDSLVVEILALVGFLFSLVWIPLPALYLGLMYPGKDVGYLPEHFVACSALLMLNAVVYGVALGAVAKR